MDRRALLHQLEEVLAHVSETGDVTASLDAHVSELAAQLWKARDGETDVAVSYTLGWLRWCRYRAQDGDQREQDRGVPHFVLCFIHGVENIPRPWFADVVRQAAAVAEELSRQAVGSPDPDLASSAIHVWRRVLNVIAETEPGRADVLSNVASLLCVRSQLTDSKADLDEAVQVVTSAVEAAGDDDPNRARRLYDMSFILWQRFERTSEPGDLDEAIRVATLAVDKLAEDHPMRADVLADVGNMRRDRFERTGAMPDLDEAIRSKRLAVDAAADAEKRSALLAGLSSTLRARYEITEDLADLDEAILVTTQVVNAVTEEYPDRTALLSDLAAALKLRSDRTGSANDLNEAVRFGRMAVDNTAEDDQSRAAVLNNLGVALTARFKRTGESTDLNEIIQVLLLAAAAMAEDMPERGTVLSYLGRMLRTRYERTGSSTDLDESVRFQKLALEASSGGDDDFAARMASLGNVLRARFERTGQPADVDEAIRLLSLAAEAVSNDQNPVNQASILANLGIALHIRFGNSGATADLDEAARVQALAANLVPDDHGDRAAILANLGNILEDRFARSGSPADLDEAVRVSTLAVDATDDDSPFRARRLSILSNAIYARYAQTHELSDLDEAIRIRRIVVEITTDPDQYRANRLFRLGLALRTRFQLTGAVADLNESVQFMGLALDTAPDHPGRAVLLSDLGLSLRTRFKRVGTLADVDEAVRVGTMAVDTTGEDQPSRAEMLSKLGGALLARYEYSGVLDDVDEAIRFGRLALEATPEGHPRHSAMLSNLGSMLRARFDRSGIKADIDEAVRFGTLAVEADDIDDDAERAIPFTNLSIALIARFSLTNDPADLDEAVRYGFLAVEATPEQSDDRGSWSINLAAALWQRFETTGDPADLDEAVRIGTMAANVAAEDQPIRAVILFLLGRILEARFEHAGAQTDLQHAIGRYEEALGLDSGSPYYRIQAGNSAGELIGSDDPARAVGLMERAIRLLPESASERLFRTDRQFMLGSFAGLASDAAALALLDESAPPHERAQRALSLLEAGRAVMLSQALGTRSDVSELQAEHPVLAAKLTELRGLLDSEPNAGLAAQDETAGPVTGSVRARWSVELASLLTQIRGLPGFETFGLPPSIDQLRAHASAGPVVSFTVSPHGSAALVLTADGVTALPLPGLIPDALVDNINAFQAALGDMHRPPPAASDASKIQLSVLAWLWDEVVAPVLHHLGYHDSPDGEPWPRLWWATGGLLGLLPLHAAGHHEDQPGQRGRRTVADRVVSSYTPTVRALGHARIPRRAPDGETTSLIVAMPTTPDLPDELDGAPLRFVSVEAASLTKILPAPLVLSSQAPRSQNPGSATDFSTADSPTAESPSLDRVLSILPGCTIAHFACHGISDHNDPSSSRLLLADHREHPLTVAALAPVDLQAARLAYLSACNTSTVHAIDLLDEAIHLAGAFQLAGFPHVIGTLWPINDDFAVDVATTFYRSLTDDAGRLDTDNAATALHSALRTLIDEHDLHAAPWLWAPYIHAGA